MSTGSMTKFEVGDIAVVEEEFFTPGFKGALVVMVSGDAAMSRFRIISIAPGVWPEDTFCTCTGMSKMRKIGHIND